MNQIQHYLGVAAGAFLVLGIVGFLGMGWAQGGRLPPWSGYFLLSCLSIGAVAFLLFLAVSAWMRLAEWRAGADVGLRTVGRTASTAQDRGVEDERERNVVGPERVRQPHLPRGSLPKPLSDPLHVSPTVRALVLILAILLILMLVATIRNREIPLKEFLRDPSTTELLQDCYSLLMFLAIFRILPTRVTNAFYLRSFRNDAQTWPIRQAAQAALGRAFRLSGIRDPRRRFPLLLRAVVELVFVFRYATPKYMNLEAGSDWKRRLWRSLGDVRCVLIDIRDLTDFVKEEIELCYHCVGLERILFIGDSSREEEKWKTLASGVLNELGIAVTAPVIRVAVWDETREGRRAFKDKVSIFAQGLPPGTARLRPETLQIACAGSGLAIGAGPTEGESWTGWGLALVPLVLLLGLFLGCLVLGGETGIAIFRVAFLLGQLLGLGWISVSFVIYLFECGSILESVLAAATFGPLLVFPLLWLFLAGL
jgi:hypothetical protein